MAIRLIDSQALDLEFKCGIKAAGTLHTYQIMMDDGLKQSCKKLVFIDFFQLDEQILTNEG